MDHTPASDPTQPDQDDRGDHGDATADPSPTAPPDGDAVAGQVPAPAAASPSTPASDLPRDASEVLSRVPRRKPLAPSSPWQVLGEVLQWGRLGSWLVAIVMLLVVATAAPRLLLEPPDRHGREGLARWRAWATGQLAVTEEHADELYAGFVVSQRSDGATVLGSAGDDGRCWKLVVTEGTPVGPSIDPGGEACQQ